MISLTACESLNKNFEPPFLPEMPHHLKVRCSSGTVVKDAFITAAKLKVELIKCEKLRQAPINWYKYLRKEFSGKE